MENNINSFSEINGQIANIKEELAQTKAELGILYEISNAMRSTLRLDRILYVILTGATAHVGLGFNRAMLFLINRESNLLEGKMGIGPATIEEAGQIWKQIESRNMTLEDLVDSTKSDEETPDTKINEAVRKIRIRLDDNTSILALAYQEGLPLNINRNSQQEIIKNDPSLKLLDIKEEFVVVPLKARDKVIGLILADNIFTGKTISQNDVRILTMFANQAGLAIENSRLYEQSIIQAHSDSLSGLWNHGYCQFELSKEIRDAHKNNYPISILMIDIDNFKTYNDTLGHQAGDKVIGELSTILKDSCRREDFACRYGGEEFAVILPHSDKKAAFVIGERIRKRIEEHKFKHEEILPAKKLTVSMGIATFPEDACDKDELIAKADSALYEAKREGRNRVCAYPNGMHTA